MLNGKKRILTFGMQNVEFLMQIAKHGNNRETLNTEY